MQIESVLQLSHEHIFTRPPFHPLYIPTCGPVLLINPRFLLSYLDLTLGSFTTLLSLCPLLDIGPQDQIHVALWPRWGPSSMSNLLKTFKLRSWLPGVKNLLTHGILIELYSLCPQGSCTSTLQTWGGTLQWAAGLTRGRSRLREPTWPSCLTNTFLPVWTPSEPGRPRHRKKVHQHSRKEPAGS